jgi:hypothetical protein
MFRKVESNYDKYSMRKRMLGKLQKFCQKIYSNVMDGKLFLRFLDDLRNDIRFDLGDRMFKNKTF